MTDVILPTIGSSGYYQLRAPLDTLIVENERYTCQAIRRLSEYLANNEDPKVDIYDKYNIPEAEYDSDIVNDAYIISLQSDKGHWLYIPDRYVIAYPVVNGIPYRTSMIGISLPSLPANRDLSFLLTDIENLVTDTLGVIPVIKTVETSRVVLVSKDRHDILQAERDMLSAAKTTDRARFISLMTQYDNALIKIAELEQYIKDHFIP